MPCAGPVSGSDGGLDATHAHEVTGIVGGCCGAVTRVLAHFGLILGFGLSISVLCSTRFGWGAVGRLADRDGDLSTPSPDQNASQ
jgi:hypothetical protein